MTSASSAAVLPPEGDGGGLPLSERSWRITVVVHHVVSTVLVGIAGADAAVEESGGRQTLLLPVARYGYDVPMPVDLAHWATFLWVAALGALAGTVLGLAASALPGSATATNTAISALAIVLQFFSGVFFGFLELPGWMQQVAALFPLKWLTQGMRSAFLPEEAGAFEVAGGWEHGRTALVLAAWVIIGVMVCIRTFRWRRGEG